LGYSFALGRAPSLRADGVGAVEDLDAVGLGERGQPRSIPSLVPDGSRDRDGNGHCSEEVLVTGS
jgi:hypothetical protein